MKREVISYIVKAGLLFIVYYSSATFGLNLNAVSNFAALFWLPTGISFAAVLVFGYRMWPAIALGALFTNYIHGAPFLVACGIAIGNTLEALVTVFIMQLFVGRKPSLARLNDVFIFIFIAAFFSTMVSATIGVTSLFLGKTLSASYMSTWSAWWIGDLLSDLVVAPVLWLWITGQKLQSGLIKIIETVFLMICVIGVGIVIFSEQFALPIQQTPLTYLVFLPLIWAAFRFGPRETATSTFLFSLIAIWFTAHGSGPFVHAKLSESLLSLQSFMGVIASTSLIIAASIAERREFERRKDDFISFASHELKTPVTSIRIYTQLLQKVFIKKKERKASDYINHIDEQIEKLIHLINDLLDLSKMQTGSLEFRKEWVSLQTLLQEVVENVSIASSRKILLKGRALPQLYADRDRVGQVLSNLLSNAVKYSPENKTIVVKTQIVSNRVIIGIKDQGMGIAQEHQDKIFERFYRVAESRIQMLPGLGIGLYLSRMIVKYHGGDMWVKSLPGKGSTFFFSLPLQRKHMRLFQSKKEN